MLETRGILPSMQGYGCKEINDTIIIIGLQQIIDSLGYSLEFGIRIVKSIFRIHLLTRYEIYSWK